MIELNKQDSLKLIHNNKKTLGNKNRYVFTTRFPWNCLNCMTEIYVGYHQDAPSAIFCADCIQCAMTPNIVTYQYMRVMKEKQIKLIESFDFEQTNIEL